MNTVNSPEFKILNCLSNHKTGITSDDLMKESRADDFHNELHRLYRGKNYIDTMSANSITFYHLTEQGELRLEKMKTDVKIEKIQHQANKTAKTMMWATVFIAVFTVVSGVCLIIQLTYISKQNDILEKQLQLEEHKIESKDKSSKPKTPIENHNFQIKIQIGDSL